jgi:hypothetical protein
MAGAAVWRGVIGGGGQPIGKPGGGLVGDVSRARGWGAFRSLAGNKALLLGVAAVLPLAAAADGRGLFGLDSGTPVPVVEIALLRSLPLFAELPAPALEGLAGSLTPATVPAGTVLIRQATRGTPTMQSPPVSSMSGRTGTSCAGADAVRESGKSPCCAPSRAQPPWWHTPPPPSTSWTGSPS